jgi:hypothetical protein
MTPTVPSVDPLPLPAPPWLLWLLLTLTFVLHVVPMNLVLGGSIIGLVARLRARRRPHAARLASLVAQGLPVLIATAVTMGVAALLFLQALYGRLFFTAAVLLAVPWIAVVPILITGYYAAYAGRSTARPLFAWLVSLAFLAIAFIYANTMGLAVRPEEFLARFQRSASGLHLDLGDATLAPRFLHVLLASLAVSGVGVAGAGAFVRREQPDAGAWMMRHGALWCAWATILNFVPGFWWLAALPRDVLLMFMGRDPAATAFFTIGLLSALAAIGFAIPAGVPVGRASMPVGAAAVPAGSHSPFPSPLVAGAGCLVVSVIAMVLVRDFARGAILRAAGVRAPSAVATQWWPIAAFVVLFVAAIGTVAWMVVKLVRAEKPEPLRQA